VEAGQVLGLCGNSGNSSEPHVHIHLQDRAGLFGSAVGLPLAFTNYLADGRHVDRGEPLQGQFIRSE
jgi:murein DD-endopeptidase MepM/ murein hydrolase activator NlpD